MERKIETNTEQVTGESYVIKRFTISTLHIIRIIREIESRRMRLKGYIGKGKVRTRFQPENPEERNLLDHKGADGRMVLK